MPPDPVAGTCVGHGGSSEPSHHDHLGRSDTTVLELDPALNSAAPTADAAKLAASVDYSHCHQDQRLMPAGPHHSGAAIVLSNTVGEAAGQERRPPAAANVDPCYGHGSKTMTFDPPHLTPAEAKPPSASEHRSSKSTIGLTSGSFEPQLGVNVSNSSWIIPLDLLSSPTASLHSCFVDLLFACVGDAPRFR